MIGSVLVPLDGSSLAAEAVPLGSALAARAGAALVVLQVVPPDTSAVAQEAARAALRAAVGSQNARVQVRTGDPAEQIVAAAAELPDALIVMTTHGRSGLGRWVFGSVAARVVHGASVPVLLLRAGMAAPAIRNILVPLDGSNVAEAALPWAEELATLFDAQLHLVRVVQPPEVYGWLGPQPHTAARALTARVERLLAEATGYVRSQADQARQRGLAVEWHLREGGTVEQLLVLERDAHIDLTVMATQGQRHAGLSRVASGTVAEQLLRQGATPVLMLDPRRDGRAVEE